MICANCQTILPDEALACWKCGTQFAAPPAIAPAKKTEPDILLVIFTFIASVGFFACAGWSVPFAVWGMISTAAKDSPQWSGWVGILSGISFVVMTIACFGGFWWGSYWVIKRVIASPQ